MNEWIKSAKKNEEEEEEDVVEDRGKASAYCITECFMNFIRYQYVAVVNGIILAATLTYFHFGNIQLWICVCERLLLLLQTPRPQL